MNRATPILFLLATISFSTTAVADGTMAVIGRQACMKASKSALGSLHPMFTGEKPFEQAEVPKILGRAEISCSGWKDFWPQDSQTVGGLEVRARANVWSDAAGFQAASDSYFANLKALAESKDEPSFKLNFEIVGKSCSSCHETYRTPE